MKKPLIYINQADPRRYVFSHPENKWRGAQLNFAHKQSHWVMGVMILTSLIPLAMIFLLPEILDLCESLSVAAPPLYVFFLLVTGMIVLWAAVILIFTRHKAEQDLQRYPGEQSFRPDQSDSIDGV